MPDNIFSENKPQILLQVTVDKNNQLAIGSKLQKQQLINLLLDLVKMIFNQEDQRIIHP